MCCECTHEQSNSFRTDQPTGRETDRLIYFLTLAVLLFFSVVEISALYFAPFISFQLFHELLFVDIFP
jgi:hypothetical protein